VFDPLFSSQGAVLEGLAVDANFIPMTNDFPFFFGTLLRCAGPPMFAAFSVVFETHLLSEMDAFLVHRLV